MMHLGPFKNIRAARKDPEFDRVDVRCEFENGPMIVRIAFDPSGKIAGPMDAARRDGEGFANIGFQPATICKDLVRNRLPSLFGV